VKRNNDPRVALYPNSDLSDVACGTAVGVQRSQRADEPFALKNWYREAVDLVSTHSVHTEELHAK